MKFFFQLSDSFYFMFALLLGVGTVLIFQPRVSRYVIPGAKDKITVQLIDALKQPEVDMVEWWRQRDLLGVGWHQPDYQEFLYTTDDRLVQSIAFVSDELKSIDLAIKPSDLPFEASYSATLARVFSYETARQANGYFFENGDLKKESWLLLITELE